MKQAILAGVLIALASQAQAVPITFSQSFSMGPAGTIATTETGDLLGTSSGQQGLALPRFDGGLGTLDSVAISIASSWFHRGELVAHDGIAAITNFISCTIVPTILCEYQNDAWVDAAIFASFQVALTDPAGASALSSSNLQSGSCAEDPEDPRIQVVDCQYSLVQAGSFDGSLNLSGIGLASFVGSDPLDFLLRTQFLVSGLCDTIGADNEENTDRGDVCTVSSSLLWSGSVSATYSYTPGSPTDPGENPDPNNPPVNVPEPGTLVLFIAGLIGLAAVRGGRSRNRLS